MFFFLHEVFLSSQRAKGTTLLALALYCVYCEYVYVNKRYKNTER